MSLEYNLKKSAKEGRLARELVRLGFWPESFLNIPEGYGLYVSKSSRNNYLDIVECSHENAVSGEAFNLISEIPVKIYITEHHGVVIYLMGLRRGGIRCKDEMFWDALCEFISKVVKELRNGKLDGARE